MTKRQKGLKQPLRSLRKEKFGNLPRRTREAYKDLCGKQKITLQTPTEKAIREEIRAYTKWQRLADLEEEFFKQTSKVHWLEVGDGNNNFFHNASRIREVKKCYKRDPMCKR